MFQEIAGGRAVPVHSGQRKAGATLLMLALLVAGCGGEAREAAPAEAGDPLLQPGRLAETAPPTFRARFETSAGSFTVEVHRDWAPLGADRFYNLARSGYYDDTRIYRVIEGFMAQWGISGDPVRNAVWLREELVDDPVRQSNTRGRVTFATAGPNTRTTELFVNYGDNSHLDELGFAPFG
jgi:peptidyl-prolyl cis-trans isomerase A (cyclophilin A)